MKTARVDDLFKAFADETRLRILHLLAQGELCVCDIMSALKSPQSKVSRHLAYLRHAGLVTDRKQGLWRYYALAKPASRFQKGLINCLSECFEEVETLKKDRLVLAEIKKKACC